ncbi:hypothetical protein EJB05_05357, partial [Eragrostis curvula]
LCTTYTNFSFGYGKYIGYIWKASYSFHKFKLVIAILQVLGSWRNRMEISQEDIPLEHVKACIEIGTMCTNHSAAKRPTTQHILEIFKNLEATDEFEPGVKPSKELLENPAFQFLKPVGTPDLKIAPLLSQNPYSTGKQTQAQKRNALACQPSKEVTSQENIIALPSTKDQLNCYMHENDDYLASDIRRSVREAALSKTLTNKESHRDQNNDDASEHFFIPLCTSVSVKEMNATKNQRKQVLGVPSRQMVASKEEILVVPSIKDQLDGSMHGESMKEMDAVKDQRKQGLGVSSSQMVTPEKKTVAVLSTKDQLNGSGHENNGYLAHGIRCSVREAALSKPLMNTERSNDQNSDDASEQFLIPLAACVSKKDMDAVKDQPKQRLDVSSPQMVGSEEKTLVVPSTKEKNGYLAHDIRSSIREAALSKPVTNIERQQYQDINDDSEHFLIPLSVEASKKEMDTVKNRQEQGFAFSSPQIMVTPEEKTLVLTTKDQLNENDGYLAHDIIHPFREAALSKPSTNIGRPQNQNSDDASKHFLIPLSTGASEEEMDAVKNRRKQRLGVLPPQMVTSDEKTLVVPSIKDQLNVSMHVKEMDVVKSRQKQGFGVSSHQMKTKKE